MPRKPLAPIPEDRLALIAAYAYLPVVTASRLRHHTAPGMDQGDMVGAGNFGLCVAARDYDFRPGNSFKTYAITLIRGAILEMLREWDHVPRSVREAQRDDRQKSDTGGQNDTVDRPLLSLDDFVTASLSGATTYSDLSIDEDAPEPEALAIESAEREVVRALLQCLPKRDREVMTAYYWEGLTFKQIGRAMGVSESRAYQLHQRALGWLRLAAVGSSLAE